MCGQLKNVGGENKANAQHLFLHHGGRQTPFSSSDSALCSTFRLMDKLVRHKRKAGGHCALF